MTAYPDLPPEIEREIARACRLEWWTIGFLLSIVLAMYLTLGSSQAMRTAWIEDMLSLLPPVLFLAAARIERRPPTRHFPYGFHRVGSLAFFAAAGTLTAMGAFLLWEAAATLIRREHPTIGSVTILGREVWLGWLMMLALVYSVIPPVILGRMKRPIAKRIGDKVLFTDADMNAADWQTGLAALAGVIGIGFGLWWADAVAAGFISVGVLRDGISNLRTATAELIDGAPREIGGTGISDEAREIAERLGDRDGRVVLLRETGRFMRALILPERGADTGGRAGEILGEGHWRLIEVSEEAASRSVDLRKSAALPPRGEQVRDGDP